MCQKSTDNGCKWSDVLKRSACSKTSMSWVFSFLFSFFNYVYIYIFRTMFGKCCFGDVEECMFLSTAVTAGALCQRVRAQHESWSRYRQPGLR